MKDSKKRLHNVQHAVNSAFNGIVLAVLQTVSDILTDYCYLFELLSIFTMYYV